MDRGLHFPSRFHVKLLTHLQKSVRKHPKLFPKKPEHVKQTKSRTSGANYCFKSGPHMAPQADAQSGECSYIDLLSFIDSLFKNWTFMTQACTFTSLSDLHPCFSLRVFSLGAMSYSSLEEHIAFCYGFNIIPKYCSTNDLLNQT